MFYTLVRAWGLWLTLATAGWSAQTVYPSKDGTLLDGAPVGPFDGIADEADWLFNGFGPGYEGSITLVREGPTNSFEHRLVWEYNLSTVTVGPWVDATLTFTLIGAPVYPLPDADVHIYSYPADLVESLSDFSAGPAVLVGSVVVVPSIPFQPPTTYTVDVSDTVSQALVTGTKKVAFRMQIDPNTQYAQNQAFMDAKDGAENLATKPFLTITQGSRPGDYNGDGHVDLADFAVMVDCLNGPQASPAPSLHNVTVSACLEAFDSDHDADVDMIDVAALDRILAP